MNTKKRFCTIRQVAEVTGQLVAAQAGVWIAPLYYTRLEIAKKAALLVEKGNFEGKPVITVKSDASKKGLGGDGAGDGGGGQ